MRVLLAGWSGFDEVIATVGDELGADTVARRLTGPGVPFDVAEAPFPGRGLSRRDVDPADHTVAQARAWRSGLLAA
ncbi:MAG TPA: hypothetical protein VJ352_07015 [Geodermatophilus sp.]|nr:hypothetical protein [Geodermatophilus sp.]